MSADPPPNILRHAAWLTLSLAVGLYPAAWGRDGDDDGAGPARPAARADGATPTTGGVDLDAGQIQLAGLVVEPLRAVAFQPETAAYGKVLDIQPLLELRVRHRAARAEAEVAAAALDLARRNRERLGTLHREDIVAERELIHAEAQWQSDRAKAGATLRLLDEIRHQAEQAWGAAVARLALDEGSTLFDELLSHRRVLLLVALPRGYVLPQRETPLFIAKDAERAKAVRAYPIAPATQTDDLVQGETWFYQAADASLRSGMRVQVWAPLAGTRLNGVALPLTAVVWQGGKPWVYRQTGPGRFGRVEVAGYREHGGAWLVERGFAAGDRIVVTGAQSLLSEEFRGGIPDEDDD